MRGVKKSADKIWRLYCFFVTLPLQMKMILIYLIVINVVTFVIYGYDKWQSQHGGWRISERALLGLVAAFGGVGALAGMWGLRHKTKHHLFVVGVPAIMLVEFLLFNVVLYMVSSSW